MRTSDDARADTTTGTGTSAGRSGGAWTPFRSAWRPPPGASWRLETACMRLHKYECFAASHADSFFRRRSQPAVVCHSLARHTPERSAVPQRPPPNAAQRDPAQPARADGPRQPTLTRPRPGVRAATPRPPHARGRSHVAIASLHFVSLTTAVMFVFSVTAAYAFSVCCVTPTCTPTPTPNLANTTLTPTLTHTLALALTHMFTLANMLETTVANMTTVSFTMHVTFACTPTLTTASAITLAINLPGGIVSTIWVTNRIRIHTGSRTSGATRARLRPQI